MPPKKSNVNEKNELLESIKQSISVEQLDIAKNNFLEDVKNESKLKKDNKSFFTKERCDKIISLIGYYKEKKRDESNEWNLGNYYNKKNVVFKVENELTIAIRDKKNKSGQVKLEDLKEVGLLKDAFDNIYRVHDSNSHVGSRKTWELVRAKYGQSYPLWMCNILKRYCPICIRHQQHQQTKAGHTPIQTTGFLSRVQIDLIEMSMLQDGEFKYILSIKDLGTKFVDLSALSSKKPNAVAIRLVELFTIIGVPAIIQTDNGSEFQDLAYTEKDGSLTDIVLDNLVSGFFYN